MIGSQIGPYRVEAELGTGGMGTVYLAEVADRAHGLEIGRKIALKIVHPHLLATPGFFKRFLQEAELGRKVDHENVVRTYEVDATLHEDRQVNYMAMEYVEGRSLRELLNDLRVIPESLLREVALQTTAGLAAIHAQGIVHRDLKPENVLITDDHQIRIMDLGVAKLQEASMVLTREGQFTGSLLYAAPEQCESKNVGPPADLYALGVMLYELATGSNPFRRDDAVAVIKAHISLTPPPASERNPDVSRFFAELAATLMAKLPAKRFESAAALEAVLTEGEKSEWWKEREKQLHTVIAELPTIQVRRETGVHGRDEELKDLADAWEKAKEGEGNVLFIEGEAGLGKSRLVDAFLRSLKSDDVHVLYGSFPPSGGLGGLSDAILGKFGSAGLESNIAPYMAVTPSLIPAFAALARHESPPTGSEPLQGDALHAVCCNLMRALAEEKPTIWVIEDIHFAPADSRKLLLSLARAVAPHRVLIIATARPGLPESDIANLSRLEQFHRVTLRRLGARDVIKLLQDAFHSEALAEKLGGKIAYKSDGVPFFVFEMIRGLKEGRFLTEQADGTYVQTQMITDIEVPSAVRDLIEARLKELTDDDRALLDVAAVQGYEFDIDLIARVREMKKVQVLERLAALERRHGVIRSEAGANCFDHYQLQEILYRDLMPELRTEYHGLLAEAFADREDLEPDDAEGDEAYFMARHGLRGSRPKSAVPYLTSALDYLTGNFQNDAAIDLAKLALEGKRLLKGGARVEALLRVGRLYALLGRNPEQRTALDEAIEGARTLDDPRILANAISALAWHLWETARYDEALKYGEESVELARQSGDPSTEASAIKSLAGILFDLGRPHDGLEYLERALTIVKESGDGAGEAIAESYLGYGFWLVGDYGRRKAHHGRALELAPSAERRVTSLHNFGNVLADLGHLDDSWRHQQDTLDQARDTGFRRFEAHATHRQGEVAERRGDLDLATQLYNEARAIFAEVGHRNAEIDTLVGLGRTTGNPKCFDDAVALAEELGLSSKLLLPLAWRATLPGGDLERTLEAFNNRGVKIPHHEEMEARFLLWKATENPEHLGEAHRLLQHLVDHAPEEDRESMVENVPLNRDIVAAWKEHGA